MQQQEYDYTEYFGCVCRILDCDRFTKILKKSKISKEDYESLLKHITAIFGSWKPKKYDDIGFFYENNILLMISKLRGIIFIFRNYAFDVQYNNSDLKSKLKILTKSIDEADEMYEVKNENSINPQNYLFMLNDIYNRIYDKEEHEKMIHSKYEARREAKRKALFKYRIGDKYMSKHNLSGRVTLFEVKKTVYTVGDTIINIVIMKLLYGKPFTKNTLSRMDCKTFHIKYEPGLYVFNMNHQFRKLTDVEIDDIISNDRYFLNSYSGIHNIEIDNGGVNDKVKIEDKHSEKSLCVHIKHSELIDMLLK